MADHLQCLLIASDYAFDCGDGCFVACDGVDVAWNETFCGADQRLRGGFRKAFEAHYDYYVSLKSNLCFQALVVSENLSSYVFV